MSTDPYTTLGVKKTASNAEIKKAYRKIARNCHPDLNPEDKKAEARFKAASAAYDLLKDPETRARFDRGEIDATGAEHQERGFYRDYADRSENPYRSDPRFDDSFDASDIFAEFLRQNARQSRNEAGAKGQDQSFRARGQDQHYALQIDFLDAANGAKTRITLPDGSAIEVKIPEGSADNQTIRLSGKGAPGFGGGPNGDALVTLSLRSHPVFRRDGNDIAMVLPITLYEAVFGRQNRRANRQGGCQYDDPQRGEQWSGSAVARARRVGRQFANQRRPVGGITHRFTAQNRR